MVQDYWEQRFSNGVSLSTVGWLGLGEAFNSWMYRVRKRIFHKRVRPYVSEKSHVLDIGSGTGFYLDCWRELGVRSIAGSDFTEQVRASLAQRFDVPILRFDVGGNDIPRDRRYDAVSAMDVLFHIVDDDAYARSFVNIASVLVPGGVFIFTENFLHTGPIRAAHQVSRSLDEITEHVRRAGFDIIERVPAFVLMNTPIDSGSPALHRYWSVLQRFARIHPAVANVAGALLYFPELLLTDVVREGPSTELMICRRR